MFREANVPTEPFETKAQARIFAPDGGQGRAPYFVQASSQGAQTISGDDRREVSFSYPKSARLLSRKDFTFRRFEARESGPFKLVLNLAGSGRLGISIPKRIVKLSAGRNRIKRLWREAFRQRRAELLGWDIHVIGRDQLGLKWKELNLSDIHGVISKLISRPGCAK